MAILNEIRLTLREDVEQMRQVDRSTGAAARRVDCSRRGLTIVELLVVLSILGLLMALLLPAVQSVRATARVTQCQSNLKQIGVAVFNYESAFGMLPPGATNSGTWLAAILPFIEQRGLSNRLRSYTFNATSAPIAPDLYHCPSDALARGTDTNYAGNFGAIIQRDGANGLFRHGATPLTWALRMAGDIRWSDVTDGASQTAMAAEVLAVGHPSPPNLDRVEWKTPVRLSQPHEAEAFLTLCLQMPNGNAGINFMAGDGWHINGMFSTFYTHHLPPNSPRCTNGGDITTGSFSPSSLHSDGANVVMGDGRVQLITSSIDRRVWQSAGSRDGGEAGSVL